MKLKKTSKEEKKPKLKKTGADKPALKKAKKRQEQEPVEAVEESTPKYTDLRSVMDYTRPLTIFFSGVEQESYLDILYDLGIRNFLMSYEYLKGRGIKQLKKYPDMHLFIDSGAYTYQNDPQYEQWTEEQWEKQIEEYLAWAKKHKDSIFAIADLDLQYLPNVGYEKVYEWRRKYFEPFMLDTGIPVCFIYHEDGLDVWEYMCKRYPYVGLSLAIDKVEGGSDILRQMFITAEKYNTLCQGMASTNTKLLMQYPFYTVDSTTWLAGLKYGEISVFTGTKMTRIKKNDFETKAFPMISMYQEHFDFDLIRQEDTTEMIRVNAYAFIEAEKFVRERLRSKMYWLKERVGKNDLDNLPPDFFPPCEWFFTEEVQDHKPYARKMNINPEHEDSLLYVSVATALLNWDDPQYEQLVDFFCEDDFSVLSVLHDTFVNRIVPDTHTMIDDLMDFFKACVSGEKDTLLQLGTNFDRVVKERDEKDYITDEEYDYEDVSEMEINNLSAKYLPKPKEGEEAPEISDLDDEIFEEQGIIPVRDENGKFIKGQRQVLKPKKLFSNKYPKLACDMCVNAQRCPEYKAGYVCAYNKMFQRYNTRDMADVIQAMQGIVDLSMQRLQRSMMTEVLNGGLPDPNVSQMMNQSMQLLTQLQRMYESGSQEVIRQTKILRADGTQEMTTQVSNPQSGGILAQIFGNMSNSSDDEEETEEPKEVVEATSEVVED